ncbi:uncharacterized protein LOC110710074 [Chenopodium quinoa]|uniref:uncharacterized protein LOC110710074 n=1 Tax=Chenopodium quinoa TaxID=63459 RepID=UPI000B76CFB8|nr:uncharacterized protein LOC110710074 [Chenopodium quinoa]
MLDTLGTIPWLSERHRRTKSNPTHDSDSRWIFCHEKPDILGILAFDTAKSMSRIVSLYKSLSDAEIFRLRKEVIRERGITFFISGDEGFLLTLACAERLEDLDQAANVVSRLGQKCSDYGLIRFLNVYKDLKNGHFDIHKLNNYGSREMEKSVEKMEKLISLTGELYGELEELTHMEASEKKLNDWKNNYSTHNTNYDLFDNKICNQRKLVRHLKEVSLWNYSYDKVVGIMAKMVCVLYARICMLFRPYIFILQQNKTINKRLYSDSIPKTTMSGPIHINPCPKKVPHMQFLSSDNSNVFVKEDVKLRLAIRHYNYHLINNNNKVFQAAPPSTVGGSGLVSRYASVVLLAERYFNSESLIGDQARESMYNMLPSSLKMYVRSKLRVAWREIENNNYDGDALTEGWRKAVGDMLEWLVPVAEKTIMWQAERNMEKQRFDSKPTVLLLQTLHYADLEKTEATLAEVLVGLSFIYMYENRRISCVDTS